MTVFLSVGSRGAGKQGKTKEDGELILFEPSADGWAASPKFIDIAILLFEFKATGGISL
jgi:hypothetical protein